MPASIFTHLMSHNNEMRFLKSTELKYFNFNYKFQRNFQLRNIEM